MLSLSVLGKQASKVRTQVGILCAHVCIQMPQTGYLKGICSKIIKCQRKDGHRPPTDDVEEDTITSCMKLYLEKFKNTFETKNNSTEV